MTIGLSELHETPTTAESYSRGLRASRVSTDMAYAAPAIPEFGERVSAQSGLRLRFSGTAPTAPVVTPGMALQLRTKRALDIIGAGLALFFLAPLLLIVAALVKATSPGPILFKQFREGRHGTLFATFKFRSMRTDQCDATGVAQTQLNDARVTPLGRFIRKTSIDELPQLINVLRGDMSLVGPRPHVAGMMAGGMLYTELVPYYPMRLAMAPGITGWAQANGFRGLTQDARSAQARVDHDIAYIQNYSLWLDVKIVFKTLYNEFITGSGH
jgi:polysaccharide biosynthesis protein PslA